jgi:nicotinate-nucleotide adenylyltransferase
MTKKNLVLFGINADPPHLGHLEVILELKKRFDPNTKFFVMPAGIHPFAKNQVAKKEDRLEMTRLLFSNIPNVIVSDYEIHQEGTSYTLDTLKHLKKKNPECELYFVMAQDVANHFFAWKEPYEILSLATPIIVPRLGYVMESGLIDKFKAHRLLILPIKTLDVSSTQIREEVKRKGVSSDLTEDVMTYIKEHRLYT